MSFKDKFLRIKEELLTDDKICKENRKLFIQFFEYQEEKLKRINDIANLDEACYKTLTGYVNRFKNVNAWFKNKPWKNLTVAEIKKVYNDLEDGKITNFYGKRFGDRRSYYNKVFKSKPFDLAGKSEEVKEAMGLFTDRKRKEVQFINEENFKRIVSVLTNPVHLALCWLAWDIGENINTLLILTKSSFKRQTNKDTKEDEYIVWLPQIQLKRSRQPRSEVTLFPETVKYLDIVLQGLEANDKLFPFGYRQTTKFFKFAVRRSKAVCEPTNSEPSWKDLRSGMVMNLYSSYGWHSDDINLRLGHTISSKELEAYFSYAAGKSKTVKKLHYNNTLEQVKEELEQMKQVSKAHKSRILSQDDEMEQLKAKFDKFNPLLELLEAGQFEVTKDTDGSVGMKRSGHDSSDIPNHVVKKR